MISIITATYNRSNLIENLFVSLKDQTNKDFEWIIVDDGSTDDTAEKIAYFINESKLSIKYIQQSNKGKHVAINRAINFCEGEWVCIVDSDDYLTNDAIEILSQQASQIDTDLICGISAIKVTPDNQIIGKHPENEIIDMSFFDYYYRQKYSGDRLLMFRTELMKQTQFPVFENEKFLPEGIVWQTITKNKLVRFISAKLNIGEYQPDGLSAKYRKLMEANPVGNALYYKMISENERATFITKIKCSLMHLYLLEIAQRNNSVTSAIIPDKRLYKYHLIAKILMPFYKLKRILCN